MEQRFRIKSIRKNSLNDQDRLDLVRLLAKAGYSVRIVKDKKENSSSAEYSVEFWEE